MVKFADSKKQSQVKLKNDAPETPLQLTTGITLPLGSAKTTEFWLSRPGHGQQVFQSYNVTNAGIPPQGLSSIPYVTFNPAVQNQGLQSGSQSANFLYVSNTSFPYPTSQFSPPSSPTSLFNGSRRAVLSQANRSKSQNGKIVKVGAFPMAGDVILTEEAYPDGIFQDTITQITQRQSSMTGTRPPEGLLLLFMLVKVRIIVFLLSLPGPPGANLFIYHLPRDLTGGFYLNYTHD